MEIFEAVLIGHLWFVCSSFKAIQVSGERIRIKNFVIDMINVNLVI